MSKKKKFKGIIEQLSEGIPRTKFNKESGFTLDAFKDMVKAYEKNRPQTNHKTGRLTDEEVIGVRQVFGMFLDGMGDELYWLPNGSITGKQGWEDFNSAVKDWFGKDIVEKIKSEQQT